MLLGIHFDYLSMLSVPFRRVSVPNRYCHEEVYGTGDIIFSPGDDGDRFYIITDGQVRSLRHNARRHHGVYSNVPLVNVASELLQVLNTPCPRPAVLSIGPFCAG